MASLAAAAHELTSTSAALALRPDGAFSVEMSADLDALLLGAAPAHDSGELARRIAALPETEREERVERLRELFRRRVRVRFDGSAAEFEVSFPDRGTAPEGDDGGGAPPSWLGLRARLTGHAPNDWREVTFFASRAFRELRLTVLDIGSGRTSRYELVPGEESPPFPREGPSSGR